jgi:hypothetical protein
MFVQSFKSGNALLGEHGDIGPAGHLHSLVAVLQVGRDQFPAVDRLQILLLHAWAELELVGEVAGQFPSLAQVTFQKDAGLFN